MLTLTQEQIHNIGEDYKNGESVFALSRKYHCSTGAIKYRLNKLGISKISQAKRLNPNLIEDYFESIDNANKAYWIGWLLTDGSVTKESNNLQMSLVNEDVYILNLLEDDLHIKNHVSSFGEKYCRFSFGSKRMIKDLEKYGIIPNKTLTLKFPTNIPDKFDSHLLRGMFEGDGGLTIGVTTRFNKDRGKHYIGQYQELSFTGTYDMCEGFQNTILKHLDIPKKNIKHNHSIHRIRWSNKEEIIKILDFLYKDCGTHYLKRKYNLYQLLKRGDKK